MLEFQFQKPTSEPQEDGPLKEKDDFSHFQEFPDILKQSNHSTLEALIPPIWRNTHDKSDYNQKGAPALGRRIPLGPLFFLVAITKTFHPPGPLSVLERQ